MTSFLHLTPAVFLFWHSWIFQLPLTQLTIAYFMTNSKTCTASPVLHSPGFLLIWQIEHSQSSSMTTSHKSQAFPMMCHRVLCWAQFSSSSTQNLFLTWFSVARLSLNLSRTMFSSKSMSLHRTFNLQYLLWRLACQTFRPGCWKTNLNLTIIKQRPSCCAHLLSPFQSANLLPSLCGCEISFSCSARNLGFYIRDDMSVELHIKSVCRLASFSWLNRNTCVCLFPL